LKLLEQVQKQEGSNPFFALQLARQYREAGNPSRAVDFLQKFVRGKADADVHHEFGLALQSMGNVAKALTWLQSAVKQQPERVEFRESLAILLSQSRKFPEAIREMNTVLQSDPNHASGWNNYGNILREAGKLKEAETAYRTAIDLNPGYATAYNGLGIVMFEQGNVQESIRHLSKAVSLDSKLHDVYFNLGIAYEKFGDWEKARSFYKKFLDVAPPEMQQQRSAAKERLDQLR
jgi:superkiller protein 3